MIWSAGRIMPDAELELPASDRAFEHGLGLFETFRTWDGRVPLLDRHLARMSDSARTLRLPLDPATLPGLEDVDALLSAANLGGDAVLRLTMSGGMAGSRCVVWLRAAPLPAPQREPGVIVEGTWGISREDPLLRHKTLNYWRKRLAHEEALAAGADETLSVTPDGATWEGSRTNLFLVEGGRLFTPEARGLILPGITRGLVLERARAIGMEVIEGEFRPTLRQEAVSEAFLTSSVRGVVPIIRLLGQDLTAPGPITRRLRDEVLGFFRNFRAAVN